MGSASSPPPPQVSVSPTSADPSSDRCPRCGGRATPLRRRKNPFLDGLDIAVVCEDCGLSFPAKPPPPPPSGRPPW
ncbi:hypothetical protein KEG38_30060 [Polyangium jinanense]|uniref:Uncharacterized protein n=1 Tax=Polyangium jinanense TaxID=2829994 RepID=A0A9X4AUW0_9BACT|nr:hypothetical protein [Polyangium jinanense]MDC3958141.1 hypothetical protein [Polyangium jinanense]MDC3983660.1 hypothetical protein [Polyangium jinanense]